MTFNQGDIVGVRPEYRNSRNISEYLVVHYNEHRGEIEIVYNGHLCTLLASAAYLKRKATYTEVEPPADAQEPFPNPPAVRCCHQSYCDD